MLRPLLCLLLASLLAAQTTRVVGPGAFTNVQAAINASAPGDIIEIKTGAWPPFDVDRPLTIAAESGAQVDIAATTFQGAPTLFRSATGTTHVAGLRFRNPTAFFSASQVTVQNSTVSFTDCLFEAHTHSFEGALIARTSGVRLERCTLLGSGGPTNSLGPNLGASAGNALLAWRSWVTAVDCLFYCGMQNWDFGSHPGAAVHCDGSALHLVRCTALGPTNSPLTCGFYLGGDGVRIVSALQVSIADCNLFGGNGHCGRAGHGLANLSTTPVLMARTNATGGAGGTPGQGLVGPTVQAPLLGLAGPTLPLAPGQTWSAAWQTLPGGLVLLAVSADLAPTNDARVTQRFWMPAGAGPLPPLQADANGVARLTFLLPPDPALRGVTAFVHAFAPNGSGFEAGPALGGVIR
ncbi:MAG: hypothetical protein IPK26_31550 [Planctomycetes bacterium]|nr:hypothetical protein [Planctomycetota bacterium]